MREQDGSTEKHAAHIVCCESSRNPLVGRASAEVSGFCVMRLLPFKPGTAYLAGIAGDAACLLYDDVCGSYMCVSKRAGYSSGGVSIVDVSVHAV